jgi:hypothetical protein
MPVFFSAIPAVPVEVAVTVRFGHPVVSQVDPAQQGCEHGIAPVNGSPAD